MNEPDCTAQALRSDFKALGLLMRRAGVAPSRVEGMMSDLINGQAPTANHKRCYRELAVLLAPVGDALAALKVDQHTTLKAFGHSMAIFRNETTAYQVAFVAVTRRMICLIIAAIVLQRIILGAVCVAPFAGRLLKDPQVAGSPFYSEVGRRQYEGAVYAG